jgi:primosomal protein N' (replication factor Y)
VTIARVGSGTQRVEAELAELLAPLEVFRLDSDSAATRGHAEVLSRFEAAESGVLVGTQMVAKGHDFPDVTLSVILDADGALRLPDFRSEERTFSLITQLAGRSGRGEAGGRVLVQALATGAPSIRHAARHDSAGFLAQELGRRSALRYPPFSHLIEIGLAGADETRVERSAETVRDLELDQRADPHPGPRIVLDLLVRRPVGHHQHHTVQTKLPPRLLREEQMSDVGRVEGPAEDPDTRDVPTP